MKEKDPSARGGANSITKKHLGKVKALRISFAVLVVVLLTLFMVQKLTAFADRIRVRHEISDMGGEILYQYQFRGGDLYQGEGKPPGNFLLKAMLGDNYMATESAVFFTERSIVDAAILAQLPTIEELRIPDSDVISSSELGRLTELNVVYLPGSTVDNGFGFLRELRSLRSLDISETTADDSVVCYLEGSQGLRFVNLLYTNVSANGVKTLLDRPSVEVLFGDQR